ncbi:MAG: DUF2520 domain-containing protein [Parvularculaceae bacterium]
MSHRIVFIGRGRVATSLAGYARALGHHAETFDRMALADAPRRVERAVSGADVLAIATPDDAVAGALDRWRTHFRGSAAVHFSGALTVAGAWSCHPLMSFPKTAAGFEEISRASFALEEEAPPLTTVFPGATNRTFVVRARDRAFYHALAVTSGGLAAHAWNRAAAAFASRFPDAPADALAAYLETILARFREEPTGSETGPVARRDRESVKANLEALADDPRIEGLYRAYLAAAWPDADIDAA